MYVCLQPRWDILYTQCSITMWWNRQKQNSGAAVCVFFLTIDFSKSRVAFNLFFVADGKEIIHFSVIPPVLYCAMLCVNSFQA